MLRDGNSRRPGRPSRSIFLTVAFSGGHIRTLRSDIIGWYRANFGPPVVDTFVSSLTAQLIDGLVARINP